MFSLMTVGKYKIALKSNMASRASNEGSLWNFKINDSFLSPEITAGKEADFFQINLSNLEAKIDQSLLLSYLQKAKGLNSDQLKAAAHELLHYLLSQLYYGEIAAFYISSKILSLASHSDIKQMMSRQVQDELKHTYILEKTLKQNFGSICEQDPFLKEILEDIYSSESWSHLLIGMQIIFEGTALSLISFLKDVFNDQKLEEILRIIEQDEGRHCSSGQKSLKLSDSLSEKENEDLSQWTATLLEKLSYCLLSGQFFFMQKKYGLSENQDLKILKYYETREAYSHTYFKYVMPMLKRSGIDSDSFTKRMQDAGVFK